MRLLESICRLGLSLEDVELACEGPTMQLAPRFGLQQARVRLVAGEGCVYLAGLGKGSRRGSRIWYLSKVSLGGLANSEAMVRLFWEKRTLRRACHRQDVVACMSGA